MIRRVGAGAALALALLGVVRPSQAAVHVLVPGQALAAVIAQAADGDEVQIPAGEYRGEVAVILQHRLILRGVGGRVVLQAAGAHAEGKAILVVRDGDLTIEDIEFRGARVPDRNGAGIRFERGRLTVRRCTFIDNENGILTSNDPAAELIVENSRFADAPDSSRLPHLLYVGAIARFTLSGSHLSHGRHAHLVKSRARENLVRNNQLVDGEGGSAAYELEFPNGGMAQVVSNVIEQSADTTNPIVLAFGAEGRRDDRPHGLHVENNTFISRTRWPAIFVRVYERRLGAPVDKVILNNTFEGPGVEVVLARDPVAGGAMTR